MEGIFVYNKFIVMVEYNPKDWFSLIFKLHKSDTIKRLLPLMICVAAYTALVVYLEVEYLHVKSSNTVHSLLGFVISLLLVFRTNTAYDRWWEGRRQLGALLNNSRNLALKLATVLKNENELKQQARILIGNYASALMEHLSGRHNYHLLEDHDLYTKKEILLSVHKPNEITFQLMTFVRGLVDNNKMSSDELRLINTELSSFSEIVGSCERIKNSPIPYSYSLFIKKFIFVYIMTLPFFFSHDFGYGMIPLTVFIFYVLVSIEVIAEEIENPFNGDVNDLPMNDIKNVIAQNIEEILQNRSLK
jgi:putative membrane protein